MSQINYRGCEGVLGAFEDVKIDTWAVVDKKYIMQAGSGADELRTYLERLELQGGSTTYMLRMYRDIEPDDVAEKTEPTRGFYFKLGDGYSGYGMQGMGGGNMGYLNRIAALEKKLKDAEEKPEKRTIGNTMLGWIESVDDVVKLAGVIAMFTGKSTPEQNMAIVSSLAGIEPKRARTPIAAITQPPVAEIGGDIIEITEEQEAALLRYASVIDRGEKCDPEFLAHMEGLVKLAETKPDTYKLGLSFLK